MRISDWSSDVCSSDLSGDAAFSVAQHSLLVDDIAGRLKPGLTAAEHLAAVLHDAAEYVIGDLITPFKSAVGPDYKVLEKRRSEEHTSELQSLMRISYAVFCLKKKKKQQQQ